MKIETARGRAKEILAACPHYDNVYVVGDGRGEFFPVLGEEWGSEEVAALGYITAETVEFDSGYTTSYHRNGVGGLGFHCWIVPKSDQEPTGAVGVKFYEGRPIVVPLGILAGLAACPLIGQKLRKTHHTVGVQFRSAVKFCQDESVALASFDDDGQTFVGIYDSRCDEVPFAVFQLDLLQQEEIAFGINSWRGDVYFHALDQFPGTPLKAALR